jgi:hypothetical protein
MVRGRKLSAVEIVLVDEDALTLAHLLKLWVISAKNGNQGRGTSVDAEIKFAEELSEQITNRVKQNRS